MWHWLKHSWGKWTVHEVRQPARFGPDGKMYQTAAKDIIQVRQCGVCCFKEYRTQEA